MNINLSAVEQAIKYFVDRTLDDHGYHINKEHCETALAENIRLRGTMIKAGILLQSMGE